MEAKQLNLKIKQAGDDHEVSVEASSTVADLKKILAERFGIATSEQKLISKGKVLKDGDALTTIGLEDGSLVNLVQTKTEQKQGELVCEGDRCYIRGAGDVEEKKENPIPPQNESINNPLGSLDKESIAQNLDDPNFIQKIQGMFTNPENVQNLVASNPFLQALVQSNPQIAGMLNDPMMLQMLADPQIFNTFLSMAGGIEGVKALVAGTPSASQQTQTTTTTKAEPQTTQSPAPTQTNPLEEKYKAQLEQMRMMGFGNKTMNIQALEAANGDVEAAVDRMLGML